MKSERLPLEIDLRPGFAVRVRCSQLFDFQIRKPRGAGFGEQAKLREFRRTAQRQRADELLIDEHEPVRRVSEQTQDSRLVRAGRDWQRDRRCARFGTATIRGSRGQPRGFFFHAQGESRAVVTRVTHQTEMDFDGIRLMQSRGQRDRKVQQRPSGLSIAARQASSDHSIVAGQHFGSIFIVHQDPSAAARLPVLQRSAIKEWLAPTGRSQLRSQADGRASPVRPDPQTDAARERSSGKSEPSAS